MDPDDRIKLIHTFDDLIAAGVQNDGFFSALKDCRILAIGIVKMEFPEEISIPSTIASVSGNLQWYSFLSKFAGDGNDAADRFYVLLHNIHADSSTGELGNFLVGRKPGTIRRDKISFWEYSLAGFREDRCALPFPKSLQYPYR